MLKNLKILKEIVVKEDLTEEEIDVAAVAAALESQAQTEDLIDLTQEVLMAIQALEDQAQGRLKVIQALEDQAQENLRVTQVLEDLAQGNLTGTQVLEDQSLLILIASQDHEEIEEINIC